MANFQANLFGRGEDTPPQYKTTANLNIRTGAGTQFDKLPASPLPQGTRVEILVRQGVWWQVDEQGRPYNKTYYADTCQAADLSDLVWATGFARQADQAEELIFVADGADWISTGHMDQN